MAFQNLVGQFLGQYELRELLGVGGMGAVYRAYQSSLQRIVAVKVLRPELTAEPGYVERFTREARTSAALEHPHIVHIYDYGTQADISYLVMQLLEGGSLAERIAQRAGTEHPLPSLGEIAELLRQVGSALDYAHSQGVVHRDIKPSNILFDNHGNAYLVDFGIAKLLEATATGLTGTGAVVGTFAYMAPEQWRAEPLTPATDQYALGVMTYALVTGHLPFEAPTPAGVMHAHLNERPRPPRVHRPDVPDAVEQVIERALAKKPGERFPTCTAFAQAFDGAIRGHTGEKTAYFTAPIRRKTTGAALLTPSPRSQPVTVARPLYRTPAFWVMAALLLIMAGVIAFLARGRFTTTLPSAEQTGTALAALPTATETPTVPALVTLPPPPTETPASTATDTPQPSATLTGTATDTPRPSATVPTDTPEPTPTLTPSPTDTPTRAPGLVILPTDTPTFTPSPVPSPTRTPSPTPSPTDTPSLTPSVTDTPTPTVDPREIARQTRAAMLTQTATQWTPTPTATYTETPDLEATIAFELTQLYYEDATATATLWTPTPTPTPTPTHTPTPTPTRTPGPLGVDNVDQIVELQRLGRGRISQLAYSPDGQTLAVASSIGIWLYDAGNLSARPRLLEGHTASVYSVAFSPDGRLLASGSFDGTSRLWEVGSGATLQTLGEHTDAVLSVAFSPDGRLLASGSLDHTIRLWEVGSGATLQTLEGHTDYVLSVAFSPDGRLLASGSGDGTVRLWGVPGDSPQ